MSGAGKSSIAEAAATILRARGYTVAIIDGDAVRAQYKQPLGFSEADIQKNNALIAEACVSAQTKNDVILVPIISPFESHRSAAKRVIGSGFYEVHIDASISTLENRDTKGFYARARHGGMTNLIGYSDGGPPYQAPHNPDLYIDTNKTPLTESVSSIVDFVQKQVMEKSL